jgi:ABC-type amino acid transport substrate-binding protein
VDAISARLWLRDHDGLELAPEYVTHDPYAAAVRADNERLWAALNAALTTLIERGAVEEVVNRWL